MMMLNGAPGARRDACHSEACWREKETAEREAMAMSGRWTTIGSDDGKEFDAYLTFPESGSGPGLVLLSEIFGVNDYIKQLASLYAAEGFVTMAPDIYWRLSRRVDLPYSDAGLEQALGYHGQLNVDLAARDVAATAKALRKSAAVNGKVGAIGFCLGGRLAYLAAVRSKLDAAVSYYGPYIERYLEEAPQLSCPLMLHCAADDQYIPMEAVEAIRRTFSGRGDVHIYVYPGVDHGYNRLGGPQYNWAVAMVSHSRSMYLLRRELGLAGI
jgi:carboxymethylenebutenolidase